MRRVAGVGLCVVAFGVAAAVCTGSGASAPGAPAAAEHDFGDKVVVVTTKGSGADGSPGGGYLEKAKVRKLGDRYFVVGPSRSDRPDWPDRNTVYWIPLADVIQMMEYDNWEAADKAHEAWEKIREQRKEKKDNVANGR